MARNGNGLVEAYTDKDKNSGKVWMGSLKMYLEGGIEVISEFRRSNVLVRKIIVPSVEKAS